MSNGQPATPPTPTPASTATTIKPADLRGILKYVPRFQGQIFVIAVDGAIVADENFANILVDIAVLKSLGIKVVIVHGTQDDLVPVANVPFMQARLQGARCVKVVLLEGRNHFLPWNSEAAVRDAIREALDPSC